MRGPRDAIPAVTAPGECLGCEDPGRDSYSRPDDNPWTRALAEPLSTFSIDVDTASYSNVRRFLRGRSLPPTAAVRSEELINYFDYDYAQPGDGRPLAVHAEVAPCPWNPTHKLVHVGLQGKLVTSSEIGPRNLVFLVDVSGSMESEDKLPLLRAGLKLLVADLKPHDRISMVAYAGASGLVLPPTSGANKLQILRAIDELSAGGSTNGGAGIALAYAQARKHFIQSGVNRVVLASDGDFNVGVTDHDELVRLVEQQRASGVYLSVLGFGRGNLNDHTMEQLADKGNGNYAYIDSEREAEKVLVTEAAGTLVTVARDVKLQVEWNPAAVAAYRLIGYENRRLAAQDFKDDRKDAGELGAGHDVTGIYEVVPAGTPAPGGGVDPLKYQLPAASAKPGAELMTVKVRYKPEGADASSELQLAVRDTSQHAGRGSDALRFAAAVAAFGERLRDPHGKDGMSFADIATLAQSVQLPDPRGDRKEFIRLVREAQKLVGDAPIVVARLQDDELG
ncbi:MAG: VWA domain-containing protein [Nannocystis sp.]|nr:VWA domain-containing protein [Nannocystis sp.]